MITQYFLQQELNRILGIEAQLAVALPFVAESTQHHRLQRLFRYQVGQTRRQRDRLLGAEEMTGITLREARCDSAEVLIADLREVVEIQSNASLRDLMLANKMRLIKNYETTSYSRALHYTWELGYIALSELLDAIRQEEKRTEAKLTVMIHDLTINLNQVDLSV